MPIQTGDNKFAVAQWIVDPVAGLGTHTTIASALASASSGDTIFIRPGVYTENLTLVVGVDLTAFECDAQNPNVTIVGNCTFSGAGTVSCSGIRFQTNGAACITVSGASASILNLVKCFILADDATAISFTSSSSSALIYFDACRGDISTTGIAYFSSSSAGTVRMVNGYFQNNGLSSTTNTFSAGNFFPFMVAFDTGFTMSGTASMSAQFCSWNAGVANATAMTISAGTSGANFCTFNGGTAVAIFVDAGATFSVDNADVSSSNANALDGTGTINLGLIVYTGSSSTNNISTQNERTTQPTLGGASGVMVQQVRNSSSAAFSTSVAIPTDGTIPQITEGGEFITASITPLNAANILRIEYNLQFDLVTNPIGTSALFVDATANALAAFPFSTSTASYRKTFSAVFYTTAGSTSARTYRVRVGLATAVAVTINPNVYGGVNFSSITISEITP